MKELKASSPSTTAQSVSLEMNSPERRTIAAMRAFAIMGMITIHVFLHYALPELQDSSLGFILQFWGGPPAAPVFMFTMGMLAWLSRKSAKHMLIRALSIFAAGYLLNVLRFVLPLWTASFLGLNEQIADFPSWSQMFFSVDILTFAGLAYASMVVLRSLNTPAPVLFLLAVTAAALGPVLSGRYTGLAVPDAVLELFIGSGSETYFMYFPWIAYPLLGGLAAQSLARLRDIPPGIGMLISAGLFAIGGMYVFPGIDALDYYRHGVPFFLMTAGWIGFEWFLFALLSRRAQGEWKSIQKISGQLSGIYIIHWIIIGWGTLIIGYQTVSNLAVLAGLLGIIAILTAIVSKVIPIKI
jgi:hypothetical protein